MGNTAQNHKHKLPYLDRQRVKDLADPKARELIPARPGIYMFSTKNRSIIYVGVANDLRQRFSSEFNDAQNNKHGWDSCYDINGKHIKFDDLYYKAVIFKKDIKGLSGFKGRNTIEDIIINLAYPTANKPSEKKWDKAEW